MDRCAVFVDVGYLIAEGGSCCCGTKRRGDISCNYETLVKALIDLATSHCKLPVLRLYWYDGAPAGVATQEHLKIAKLKDVKVRLGRIVGGQQKGVDSLIFRDLMILARERAMETAFVIGGDEDLREGVSAAQDMGCRVIIVGVSTASNNQSFTLVNEADDHLLLDADFLKSHLSSRAVTVPSIPIPSVPTQPSTQAQPLSSAPADPNEIGTRFGTAWANATPDQFHSLTQGYPKIPVHIDVQLIQEAEKTLGSLREREPIKRILRKAFWKTIRDIESQRP